MRYGLIRQRTIFGHRRCRKGRGGVERVAIKEETDPGIEAVSDDVLWVGIGHWAKCFPILEERR